MAHIHTRFILPLPLPLRQPASTVQGEMPHREPKQVGLALWRAVDLAVKLV